MPTPTKAPARKAPARKVDCWTDADAVVQHSRLTLLFGPPGTGKSYTAVREAQRAAQRLTKVTLTARTPAAELRGHWVPTGDRGSFQWHHGPAIRAWLDGDLFLVDEIDHADEDALDLMLALFDDIESARITLPSGEEVRPDWTPPTDLERGCDAANGFRAICTMNGDPADLPDALQDRLTVRCYIDRPHPDAILALPEDLRHAAERLHKTADPGLRISMRALRAFGHLRGLVGHDTAGRTTFGSRWADVVDALAISRVPGA